MKSAFIDWYTKKFNETGDVNYKKEANRLQAELDKETAKPKDLAEFLTE